MIGESLDDIVKRTKLPVSVEYYPAFKCDDETVPTLRESWCLFISRCRPWVCITNSRTASEASQDYFDLVSSLTNPATSSPAGNLGGCSANSSTPEGVGL